MAPRAWSCFPSRPNLSDFWPHFFLRKCHATKGYYQLQNLFSFAWHSAGPRTLPSLRFIQCTIWLYCIDLQHGLLFWQNAATLMAHVWPRIGLAKSCLLVTKLSPALFFVIFSMGSLAFKKGSSYGRFNLTLFSLFWSYVLLLGLSFVHDWNDMDCICCYIVDNAVESQFLVVYVHR